MRNVPITIPASPPDDSEMAELLDTPEAVELSCDCIDVLVAFGRPLKQVALSGIPSSDSL
jgi:hypothetical protein